MSTKKAGIFGVIQESWKAFTPTEKRNVAIYIGGIMLYKFGLEAFNGSIVALATNRYDYEAFVNKTPTRTFERVGLLTALNQATQCVGSILIAPLVKRFRTKNVLAGAVFFFGLMTAILLIIDAASGGTFVPAAFRGKHPKNDFSYYGDYNTDAIIVIYTFSGVAYGMVELIRRVIPRDLVGGNVQKLRRMDALVHIFYEIAGTSGAFCTALALIPRFGNNYSFLITPICFSLACAAWFLIGEERRQKAGLDGSDQPSYIKAVLGGAILFFESIWTGAKILFSSRRFVWLLPGYSIALYGHRYLENGLAPQISRRYLGNSAWSQIMVGGSNLGELLGALFVFLLTNLVNTPIPWLRFDALTLLIVWFLPYWNPPSGQVSQAWIVAGTFVPISFGWAAGDVSLAAYIQASIARIETQSKNVSALGAVMAFLYSTYITMYAIASPLLGRYIDGVYNRSGGANGGDIRPAIRNVAGVQFTVLCVVVLASTLIPKGAISFNPKMINEEDLDKDLAENVDFMEEKNLSRPTSVTKIQNENLHDKTQTPASP